MSVVFLIHTALLARNKVKFPLTNYSWIVLF